MAIESRPYLPTELVIRIFSILRASATNGDFVKLLQVCRRWNRIAAPLLWRYTVATNASIRSLNRSLLEEETPLRHCRSLTLNLHSISSAQDGSSVSYKVGEAPRWYRPRWENNPAWVELLDALVELSRLMPIRLQRLQNVSLCFQKSPLDDRVHRHSSGDEVSIPSKIIGDFLRALPSSCTSIELDTTMMDSHVGGPEHLCTTIRLLLPRLQHAQFRLHQLCPNIIDPKFQRLAANSHRDIAFEAPHLRTLMLIISDRMLSPRTILCEETKETQSHSRRHHRLGENTASWVLSHVVPTAIQRCWEAGAMPQIERAEVLHVRRFSRSLWKFLYRDILSNKTTVIPARPASLRPDDPHGLSDVLYARPDPDGTNIFYFGTAAQLEQSIGNAWRSTTNGDRVPESAQQLPISSLSLVNMKWDDAQEELNLPSSATWEEVLCKVKSPSQVAVWSPNITIFTSSLFVPASFYRSAFEL
ncbi:hypothetical protein BDY21DRAFT_40198 [Lineolata rhizophorae]|uniref:F-box domain-containing protein n=1 Tax=Lineolata rhizophorae TaxID=578093 RepID=A0A6A6NYK7_9PEZI|nr:hypothetical protein BDY21DRAFT_40198 [Lineolata rhizophorae]